MKPADFFLRSFPAAIAGGHLWPDYAVSEAALESGWGESKLAREANNLFGQKQHSHPDHGSILLPTREYLDHQWKPEVAAFEKFDSWEESFRERMNTIERLAAHYPHYAAALASTSGVDFVTEVSKSWATDPGRAEKVLEIYRAHQPEIARAMALTAFV